MSDSTSASKRRRTSDTETSNEPPKRSKKLWFEDGNIVIQVTNYQFRVHRSVLATHSIAFRDMFGSIAPPVVPNTQSDALNLPNSNEFVDGCPIVHLTGDSAHDWKQLLQILYRIAILDSKAPFLPTLSAMARLGKKYQFDGLRREACKTFRDQFPLTLADFDSLATELDDQTPHAEWITTNLFEILRFSEQAEIRTVLPVVYFVALSSWYEEMTGEAITERKDISARHLRALLKGRIEIASGAVQKNLVWIFPMLHPEGDDDVTDPCTRGDLCTLERTKVAALAYPVSTSLAMTLTPFSKTPFVNNQLCNNYRSAATKKYELLRESIWESLPSYFMDTDWEDLEVETKNVINS